MPSNHIVTNMRTPRKPLQESLYEYDDYKEAVDQALDYSLQLYGGAEYAELAVLLGFLRALGIMHQSHHWQTKGDPFFGDHLLYERLYSEVVEEIDALGERAVGVGGPALTNYFIQLEHIKTYLKACTKGAALYEESLRAEISFLIAGELVMERLDNQGILTRGIEQAIGNIMDVHESHIYLLQQRNRAAEFEKE